MKIVNVGPSPSEIALISIVSLFGYGIGPAVPAWGQSGSNGLYHFQLGGTQFTFDGVATPQMYFSQGQINLSSTAPASGQNHDTRLRGRERCRNQLPRRADPDARSGYLLITW